MTKWLEDPLEEYLERITYGFTNPMPTANYGPFMITAKDINDGRILYEQARCTSLEAYKNLLTDKSRPRVGDVLVTKDGSLGRIAIVDRNHVCINQSVALLRPNPKKIRTRFLKYLLEEPKNHARMLGDADGTTIKHIYITRLGRMLVRVPDIDSQDDILDVIAPLDDKIELNRQMNETLEKMAHAVFHDWFVDFGPVRRKLAGATGPVAIMGGLTPDVVRASKLAIQFPDNLSDEGLPEGWKNSTLKKIATINDESWNASKHPDTIRYIDLSNTKWGVIGSTATLAWSEAPSRARRIVKPLDTIVGTVRPGNGSYAFISTDGYTSSTGFAVLRPKQPEYADAVYIASTRAENIQRLANLADSHGGAYPAVNPEVVLATDFAFPGHEALVAFSYFARPIREKIEHAKRESRILAETRDYLLPKLVSGEVCVCDAKRTAEEAMA
jgi:type I restriction enzyme S subunit